MNSYRKALKNIPLIKAVASIKITVVCLILLFILTFWGTVAQVDQGLFQAQERYFHSWYFLTLGFLPFPGAKLVLWVLFLNLVCVSITRFVYKLSHLGILVTHIGLLTYFISAFVTLQVVEESNVTLMEGDATNVSVAYHDWELSIWKAKEGQTRNVIALDTNHLKSGDQIVLNEIERNLVIKNYFKNTLAYTKAENPTSIALINDSGIKRIEESPINIEPEKNFPGILFELVSPEKTKETIVLYGGEVQPTSINVDGHLLNFQLRRKRSEIPFLITLKEFHKEMHPGTEIASKYESLVEINHQGVTREQLIHMNHPLRFKNYTFYQASYAIDTMGREMSTLAVVKNSGRWLPYISSLITFVGLALHFLMMGFKPKGKRART